MYRCVKDKTEKVIVAFLRLCSLVVWLLVLVPPGRRSTDCFVWSLCFGPPEGLFKNINQYLWILIVPTMNVLYGEMRCWSHRTALSRQIVRNTDRCILSHPKLCDSNTNNLQHWHNCCACLKQRHYAYREEGSCGESTTLLVKTCCD